MSVNNFCDPVFHFIKKEEERQQSHIELIASENIVSKAVLQAQGSILTNKYAEGYPGKRYYGGCEYVDEIETMAIERAKNVFNVGYANVQSHSGATANGAVFLALLKPNDTFMGMSLDCGGHLTHGSKVTVSGQWFHALSYGVDPHTHLIDYDQVRDLAKKHHPRLIIAGGSSYSRMIDFKIFKDIAQEVGALLMVDMAHFAGLVAGGVYPSPVPFADVITTTTHKTLRGPRGGMILSNDVAIAKKIDSAVFPGLQGGPLMHVIAAKAVCFQEALQPSFKTYAHHIINNAKAMENTFKNNGIPLVSQGTDSHLLVLDLRSLNVSGKDLCHYLERVGIVVNKNSIPFDPTPPAITSGIRVGSPACTTRGFGEKEFDQVAHIIIESLSLDEKKIPALKEKVSNLCQTYPIYS
jgi:glycine hydroxymethyltransferase